MGHQKEKSKANMPGKHVCSGEERIEDKKKKIKIRTTGHLVLNHSGDMILLA